MASALSPFQINVNNSLNNRFECGITNSSSKNSTNFATINGRVFDVVLNPGVIRRSSLLILLVI